MIASLRKTRRLSQRKLGQALNLDVSAICRLERGKRKLTVGELAKLREVLNLSDSEVSALIEHLGRAEAA